MCSFGHGYSTYIGNIIDGFGLRRTKGARVGANRASVNECVGVLLIITMYNRCIFM